MRGVQSKQADEIRVFAHDARAISASNDPILGTNNRGVCIYVGNSAGDKIKVKMESGAVVTFENVIQGTFLPILVTHVLPGTTASQLIALY